MSRRLAGVVAGVLVLLAGAWSVLAPFALGTQPSDRDWVDATYVDVWSGVGLGVVGLVMVVAFAAALHQHLVERGLLTGRPQAQPVAPVDQPPAGPPANDLNALIAPLVAALTEDLARERRTPNGAVETAFGREEAPR